MIWKRIALLTSIVLTLLVLNSCSIEEADNPGGGQGVVYVQAVDISNDQPIIGADIYMNGVNLGLQTPATINPVNAGANSIRIRPEEGYSPQTLDVLVFADDQTDVTFEYNGPDITPEDLMDVSITVSPDPARLIVDEQFREEIDGSSNISLIPDMEQPHVISVFRSGYRTRSPALFTPDPQSPNNQVSFTVEQAASVGNQVGDLAIDFSLPSFRYPQGFPDTLSLGQFRGRVVLVNFWFANCDPCKEEFPYIEQTYRERYQEGFRVLGIHTGVPPVDTNRFHEFREPGFGLTFPLLWNPGGLMTQQYGVAAAPTNFFVDETGIIRYRIGATTYEDLNTILDEMLQ